MGLLLSLVGDKRSNTHLRSRLEFATTAVLVLRSCTGLRFTLGVLTVDDLPATVALATTTLVTTCCWATAFAVNGVLVDSISAFSCDIFSVKSFAEAVVDGDSLQKRCNSFETFPEFSNRTRGDE